MKVLMLGWEFPPHISGGLGTACFGLTQGLAHHGVDVAFVVPRARGDEDQRFVRVTGANQVSIAADARAAQRDGHAPAASVDELAGWTRIGTSLELLAIDSLLSPYLSAASYRERVERVAPTAIRAQSRQPAGRASATLAPPLASEKLEFSGSYGPDLMAEVARYALVIAQVARRERFDVVHAHDWMTVPAGLIAAQVSGKPLVQHVHACEYDRSGENINPEVRDIEQLGLDGANLVVCVSHYTAGMLRERYRVDASKLRVVHNAVAHRQPVDRLPSAKRIREPIVLFLGRVTFQKGPDYFLEAAARVVQIEPKVKFVMSGSGDMLPVMIERAARLGLARHVHFTGFLQGEEVARMYGQADIYVMPSVSEPFGISPLEAMALDVPVIMSRQSGVSEILRNALKVDFWDVADMANKILALLKHRALREQLSDEGRSEVRKIRWEHPAGLVRDIYEEVVR